MPGLTAPEQPRQPDGSQRVRAGWHVLTPLLFAWYPVLFLYQQNTGRTYPAELVLPLSAAGAATLLLLALLLPRVRDRRHAAVLLAAGWLFFFNYTRVYVYIDGAVLPAAWPSLTHGSFLPAYAAYAVLALWLLARLRAARPAVAAFALAAGLCLNLLTLAEIVRQRPVTGEAAPLTATPRLDADRGTPDIYFVVLDAYARADVLAREYSLDNRPFLDSLRARGFAVSDSATANYPSTDYALRALLNYTYLPAATADTPVIPGNWLEDNAVLHGLRPLGYRSIAAHSSVSWTELRSADYQLPGDPLALTAFQNAVLNLTPLLLCENRLPFNQTDLHARHLRHTLQELPDAVTTAGPAFVYVHLFAPHPPFVFNADGTRRPATGLFAFGDGSEYPGTREDYTAGYRGQVQWLNSELLALADRILGRSGREAVIILTADHGSRRDHDPGSLAKTDVRECIPVFCAVYVPPRFATDWPADLSSVNLFRVLFNSLFRAKLPLLPNRHYFAPTDRPWQFTEIPAAAIAASGG